MNSDSVYNFALMPNGKGHKVVVMRFSGVTEIPRPIFDAISTEALLNILALMHGRVQREGEGVQFVLGHWQSAKQNGHEIDILSDKRKLGYFHQKMKYKISG